MTTPGHVIDREVSESDVNEAFDYLGCFEGLIQFRRQPDSIELAAIQNPIRFAQRLLPSAAVIVAFAIFVALIAYFSRTWSPVRSMWYAVVIPAMLLGAIGISIRRYFKSGPEVFLRWYGKQHRIEAPQNQVDLAPVYPVGFEEFLGEFRHDLSGYVDSRRQLWLHVLDDDDRSHRIHFLTWDPHTWLHYGVSNDDVLWQFRHATGVPTRLFTFRDGHRIEVLDESMF